MEWMRCNSCWLKVSGGNSLFHLTQCGHVFCNKCIATCESRCVQCGSVGTISLPLSEPLSPQIAHLFVPAYDLLEKVSQAEQFQRAQLDLCIKRADEYEKKYQSLKEAYWAGAENLKKVHQKYNKLKIAYMQKNKTDLNASINLTTPSPSINSVNSTKNNSTLGNQRNQNISSNNESVFRIPMTPTIPRSASSGYYSASTSLNSCHRGQINNSRGSNY